MKKTAFRQYDIRGIVGDELLIEEIYDLVRAIVYYFVKKNPHCKTIAVGMDGRVHSAAVKEEMCRAIIDSGINVIFVGVCPSPVLYFALHTLPVDAGLMITASHNPKEYNGIKICLGTESIWGKEIQRIAQLYKEKKHSMKGNQKGTITDYLLIPAYVDWLAEHFYQLKNMNLAAIIDCGNGAAGTVMPLLIKKMGWKNITLLHGEVDGTFPHHEADPVKEVNMREVKEQLMQTDACIGIGFDGDADRMGAMLKTGTLIPGDKLLGVFAHDIVQKNPGTAVVFNVICSAALVELLEQWGARPIITAVGHSIIEEEMRKQNALLGGETSCHFFFKDRYFGYDDGIYAACRLFEILKESDKLETLLQLFPSKITSPEYRIPCSEEKKQLIVEKVKQLFASQSNITMLTIDGVRATMNYGWGILRASNTQPVLSLRFESDTEKGLEQVKNDFLVALQDDLNEEMLRKQLAA
jgi:phosphomannomutase / phosphoglucomutase